jgi:hypothetical protein
VAVGPIPSSTPCTEVYVTLDERVYQVNAYGERLDAQSRELLSNLLQRFALILSHPYRHCILLS